MDKRHSPLVATSTAFSTNETKVSHANNHPQQQTPPRHEQQPVSAIPAEPRFHTLHHSNSFAELKRKSPSSLVFYDIHLLTVKTHCHVNEDSNHGGKGISAEEAHLRKTTRGSLDHYADLIIVFKFKQPTAKGTSRPQYEQDTLRAYRDVLLKLTKVGLHYETRPSPTAEDTVLIFILCPWAVLKREVTRNSIHDWLTGVKVADTTETEQLLRPTRTRDNSLDNISDSDRLRLTYELITGLPGEGGAGIYPGQDEYVESILPLHDKAFNKSWLKSWSTKWWIDQRDLSQVRDHFGEKVAYYFEFLQFYFQWLTIPTVIGVLVYLFGSSYSIAFGFFVILWSIVYIECWSRRERELALWWGVKNVSKTEMRRPSFKGETLAVDPITGELTPFFSPWKRWLRTLAGIPVMVVGTLILTAVITMVFALEVFLTEYYDGYMKDYLVYVPTVLYTIAIPYVSDICLAVSKKLVNYENYETHASYDYHLVQKVFIFNALNSYLSILLTAYIYIPFGADIILFMQQYGLPFASTAIDPHTLRERLMAFMISDQLWGFLTETIYPWITRRMKASAVKIQKEVSEKLHHHDHEGHSLLGSHNGKTPSIELSSAAYLGQDLDEVYQFLKRVQDQVDLPEYDVNEDYSEMVIQFGYVSLFSVIWPLTGLCAFINNWVEQRSDAAKISYNTRRPIPSRTDTIGPWIDNLHHLTWFSSLTNASILFLFHGCMEDSEIKGSHLSLGILLICMLSSEHTYLLLRKLVGLVLDALPTEVELKAKKKDYTVKSSWLQRMSGSLGMKSSAAGINGIVSGAFVMIEDDVQEQLHGDMNAQLENDLGAQAIRSTLKAS
ncbi:hypothetical protein MVEG_10383 [Podila verticillata NRRL 6337]|nr:hypothetical protein MVEG_10383 [Podila verticillata NRRL 6337]